MALKDIFTMIKADRYTADGCEVLNKAKEADVEDRRYNIGEISEKTGLQKTANGWVKPKSGGAGTEKKEESNPYKMTEAEKKESMKDPGTRLSQKYDAVLKTKKGTPEYDKAMSEYLAERDSYKESQGAEAAKKFPVDPLQGTGSNSERINKSWKQSDVISSLPNGWKRVEGATTAPNGYVVVSNNKSRFGGERETKLMKEEDFKKSSTSEGRPSHEQAYLDAFKDEKLKSDVKAAIKKYGATGNNLRNALYKNDKELSDKLEKMQPDFANQFIAEMQRESKPVAKFETEQENAKYEEGKKGWETISKKRLPDIKKKVEQKIDYYKKYDPYAMLGKRTGLNAAQKKAVEQNMVQAKENLAFYTGQLEGINEQMGASDSAPRVLTGDTRIRVRKA